MRTDPTIQVACDRCHIFIEEVGLTATARGGYDERHVDTCLQDRGWRVGQDDICPDCIEKETP